MLLPGGETIKIHFGMFETSDPATTRIRLFPDRGTIDRLAQAEAISLHKGQLTIGLQSVAQASAALNNCMTTLLASWGVDPKLYFAGKLAGLTGNVAQWFGSTSYPKPALAKGASGRVVLLLRTSPGGSVAGCTVVASPDVALNDGTCAIALAHLRLKPPLDDDGRPIASYALLPVRWILPQR